MYFTESNTPEPTPIEDVKPYTTGKDSLLITWKGIENDEDITSYYISWHEAKDTETEIDVLARYPAIAAARSQEDKDTKVILLISDK